MVSVMVLIISTGIGRPASSALEGFHTPDIAGRSFAACADAASRQARNRGRMPDGSFMAREVVAWGCRGVTQLARRKRPARPALGRLAAG